MSGGPDPLFAVRNNFYLGAYQTAISEASHLTGLTEQEKLERDVYVYRSYCELNSHELVQSEISADSPAPLQAVKMLSAYLKAPAAEAGAALEAAQAWAVDPGYATNPTVLLVAGMIYALEGDNEAALKACHSGLTMEMMALSVQVCLRMDRVDAAEKIARAMAEADDDDTLAQLAAAWVGLHQGGAKVQDAYYIYQELGDKFTWTARLHCGLAACQMRMGRWEDAEAELLQAFEKNPKDADTLANLAAVCLHLGKPASRYMTLLKSTAPQHLLLQRQEAGEAAFDRAAASVTA